MFKTWPKKIKKVSTNLTNDTVESFFLGKNVTISSENVVDVLVFADQSMTKDLKELCFIFFQSNPSFCLKVFSEFSVKGKEVSHFY